MKHSKKHIRHHRARIIRNRAKRCKWKSPRYFREDIEPRLGIFNKTKSVTYQCRCTWCTNPYKKPKHSAIIEAQKGTVA